MLHDEINHKEDTLKTILTQEFDINRSTVIGITVNKENMDIPRTQGYTVTDVTTASEKSRLSIQYMDYHNKDFNQKRFLDVKYISLNNRSDALQSYESIHKNGDTWGAFIPDYPTLSKGNPMGVVGINNSYLLR